MIRSLYSETAGAREPTPALEGHKRSSVVVVGAGFTGLSAALHLAELGVEVIVLEAWEPGWGASGRNGGQVNPGWKHNPATVEATFGDVLGSRMVRFAYGAPDALFEIVRRFGIACEARQIGTIRAAYTASSLQAVEKLASECIDRSMPIQMLDRHAIADLTGTDRYLGAMRDLRGGDVHPLKLALGLARVALEFGARIYGRSPATRVVRAGGAWQVFTPSGSVTADKVLIATNGYTDGLWPGLASTIVPVFGAIAATDPLPADLSRLVLPKRSSVFESGHTTAYSRVDQANRLIIGGRGPMRPIDSARDIPFITNYAERLWPQLKGVDWRHGWNGRLAMTKDQWPHLHELAPGVLTCLGYNGRGVALGVALGPQLARRLQSDTADIDIAVTPMKQIPFHRFWRLGVAATIAAGRLRDRFGL